MRLDRIIQALLPHDEKFFSFFDNLASLLVEASELLCKLPAADEKGRLELAQRLHDLEHKADSVSHNIFNELNSTFVTPFDREDILLLTSRLDDVMDNIDGTGDRLITYKVKECPASVGQLMEVIRIATIEIQQGVHLLSDLRRVKELQACIEKINTYENQADDIFNAAIADLFDHESNAINLIKMKDIYVSLETATDRCEDVANVLESILIKHA
jgi:hypothetical protein